MPRPQKSGPSADESYKLELRDAMSRFLPHQGLPLLSGDGRVRWTSRLLAMAAILMTWSPSATLTDRFALARAALVDIYRTRRRPGSGLEGFFKALTGPGVAVLAMLCEHWRQCLRKITGEHWKIEGWLVVGVDGSKFDCPRTAANEAGFGVSGKNNSGPQQLLTCLFHVASGVLWGWTRGPIQGDSERAQFRRLLHLLPAAALLLADAGFHGYDLCKSLLDRGNSFLIRVGSNVKLIQQLGYATIERKQTVYLWPLKKQGRNRRSMPAGLEKVCEPLVLRLIELKDAKGRPVFLLTNVLDPRKLSDRAAARMYRLRWGVEVLWRSLKQTMGHHKVLSRTPERAAAELDWAMAGLWMLQLLASARMIQTGRAPTCHSPSQTLRVLHGVLTGRRRRRKSLATALGLATKDTYRRRRSKTARHYPKKSSQHPPGAPEARMATAIEKRLIQRFLAEQLAKSDAA